MNFNFYVCFFFFYESCFITYVYVNTSCKNQIHILNTLARYIIKNKQKKKSKNKIKQKTNFYTNSNTKLNR